VKPSFSGKNRHDPPPFTRHKNVRFCRNSYIEFCFLFFFQIDFKLNLDLYTYLYGMYKNRLNNDILISYLFRTHFILIDTKYQYETDKYLDKMTHYSHAIFDNFSAKRLQTMLDRIILNFRYSV